MTMTKRQYLKRYTYIGLSFFSLLNSSAFSNSEEKMEDQSIRESIAHHLERAPKLLYEYFDTTQDDVQMDIQTPAMDENYKDNHNRMAEKYGLSHRKIYRKETQPEPGLKEASARFSQQASKCSQGFKEMDENLNKAGEVTIKSTGILPRIVVNRMVQDSDLKKSLFDLVDGIEKWSLSFFKKL